MDLRGSLVDTKLRIYPTDKLIAYFQTLPEDNLPENIIKILGKDVKAKEIKTNKVDLSKKDLENFNKIAEFVKSKCPAGKKAGKRLDSGDNRSINNEDKAKDKLKDKEKKDAKKYIEHQDKPKKIKEKGPKDKQNTKVNGSDKKIDEEESTEIEKKEDEAESKEVKNYLLTSDLEWLYHYLKEHRKDSNTPYLHELLEGVDVEMPENKLIKRNPVLEARCVKLRSQQEAREYRKMTKTVDNVRMRFPEDSISYQMKQINRQLIAIGQFIISILAGFLFGFRGVELMIGNLDFGFRLLLGVMCALVIALAEIYFLAKKLNEELNIPETVQLGGPPKFADEKLNGYSLPVDKEHKD